LTAGIQIDQIHAEDMLKIAPVRGENLKPLTVLGEDCAPLLFHFSIRSCCTAMLAGLRTLIQM
jgi:hypothetical protein